MQINKRKRIDFLAYEEVAYSFESPLLIKKYRLMPKCRVSHCRKTQTHLKWHWHSFPDDGTHPYPFEPVSWLEILLNTGLSKGQIEQCLKSKVGNE